MEQMASIGFGEVALKGLDWQCNTGVELDSHLVDVEEEISTSGLFCVLFY